MTWWTESILFCPASTWTFLLKNCAPSSLITSPSWASVSSSVFNSVFHPGAGVRKGHRWHDGGTGRSIAKGTLLSLAGYASSKVEFKMCDCARVVLLSFSECLLRFSCVSGNKLVSRRDSQVCHHGFQPRRAARFFEWYLWCQLALMSHRQQCHRQLLTGNGHADWLVFLRAHPSQHLALAEHVQWMAWPDQ